VQSGTLLQRGAQGAVQAVLEIQLALPLNNMGEQVAVEGGLFGQQRCQVKVAFGGDELIEPDHPRRDISPVPRRLQTMCRIGTPVTYRPEDHRASLGILGACPVNNALPRAGLMAGEDPRVYVGVTAPPVRGGASVCHYERLSAGEANGSWDWEEGRINDVHRDVHRAGAPPAAPPEEQAPKWSFFRRR
jgi:hypothetical protein